MEGLMFRMLRYFFARKWDLCSTRVSIRNIKYKKVKGYVPLFVELCYSLDSPHNRSKSVYLSGTTIRIWWSLPPILIRHRKTALFIKWRIKVTYMNIQIDGHNGSRSRLISNVKCP